VGGDDRIRLFLALRLPEDVLDTLARWQASDLRGNRIVPREYLHVTLAFLGHRPRAELGGIVDELRLAAAGAGRIELELLRYRETRSVGMITLRDGSGRATALAEDVQARLERLGVYQREGRGWLPHVTVVRFRQRPRLTPALPELGSFMPSGAAAYLSRLAPRGAQYEVLEDVSLGGR